MNLRHTLATTTATVALVSLAACGSSSTNTATGGGQPSTQASTAAGAATGAGNGASGQIAAITGKTLQVQNQTDGQVAVTYTAKTTITAQVAAALEDVKVGSCVTVMPAQSSGSSSSSTSTTVSAGTVRITTAVNGECTGALGAAPRGGGNRPGGAPSGQPTDLPSGMPNGAAGGRGGFGADGKVTAVSASGFTVASTAPGSTSASTTSITVTVNGSTTYTTTKASDASAIKIGQCVTASGSSDDTGTVSATRLTVSAPVDGTCNTGFGRGPGAGAGTAQNGTAARGTTTGTVA
jgi:hypothetical protein